MEDDNSSVDSELENHILTWLEDAGHMNPQVFSLSRLRVCALALVRVCTLCMMLCAVAHFSEMIWQITTLCTLEDAQVDFPHF